MKNHPIVSLFILILCSCLNEERSEDPWPITEKKTDYTYVNGYQPRTISNVIEIGQEHIYNETDKFLELFCGQNPRISDIPFNMDQRILIVMPMATSRCECESACNWLDERNKFDLNRYYLYISFPAFSEIWYKFDLALIVSTRRPFHFIPQTDSQLAFVLSEHDAGRFPLRFEILKRPCIDNESTTEADVISFFNKFRAIDIALQDKIDGKIIIARRIVADIEQHRSSNNQIFLKIFNNSAIPSFFFNTCRDNFHIIEK